LRGVQSSMAVALPFYDLLLPLLGFS